MGKILKGMMIFLIAVILIGAGLFVWARYLEPSLLIVREESMTAPVSQSTRIVFLAILILENGIPREISIAWWRKSMNKIPTL